MNVRNVLVYGGKGALGQNIVNHIRNKVPTKHITSTSAKISDFRLINIDLMANEEATHNITIQTNQSFEEQVRIKSKRTLSRIENERQAKYTIDTFREE